MSAGVRVVDAEVLERLAHVEVGLAGRRRCRTAARASRCMTRSSRLARAIGQRRVDLVAAAGALLAPAARRASGCCSRRRRHAKSSGSTIVDAVGIDVDRGRANRPSRAGILKRDPAARIARHRQAVQAESRSPARRPGRAPGSSRRSKACSRWCGSVEDLQRVVVAGQQQHAAVLRRAGVVGVLEHVAAAVDARALAVPHGEHAVVLARRGRVRPAACPTPRWPRAPR